MSDPITVRAHRMPFGAEVRADGTTRFRLWAPAARTIDLWLEAESRALPMTRDSGGWAEYVTREAPAGTRYRFRIDGDILVPDPASRYQPDDVHGPSEVVDPNAHAWNDATWAGVAAERLVLYELHVGTFSREGTFAGVAAHLDHLASLGVTAIELMPVGDFPGRWGWGYDGVLPFAPEASYGRPEDLKALVEACHGRGLAVFLDVVYNHFGPEGNYLSRYAPSFTSRRHRTPWGEAINFDEPGSEVVRAFMVHNALYWLDEFHLDGLRIDAAHSMVDDSPVHILEELGRAVAEGPARERPAHLVLENDANETRYLERPAPGGRPLFQAQWNDDIHHALHVMVTGETESYYGDYVPALSHLARCLTQGFAYQGDLSEHRGTLRGEPSGTLPPTAFVGFLQNHDQIGNRALGERITAQAPPDAVRAATAILLLAPALPLVFMGQEWAAPEPFLYGSDLGGDFGAPLSVIGNDGGLLPSATQVESVFLGVGERIDFLIDFAAFPAGTRMMLRSLPFSLPSAPEGRFPQGLEIDLLELVCRGGGGADDPPLPAVLSSVPPLVPVAAGRDFVLRSRDHEDMHQINGRSFEMNRVDEQIPLGQVEHWSFSNDSTLPHPVHLHGAHFQVVSRSGGRNLVFPYEAGWKDTVLVMPLETVGVLVQFDRYRGIFPLHCHNLQHEDMGMMLNVEVI